MVKKKTNLIYVVIIGLFVLLSSILFLSLNKQKQVFADSNLVNFDVYTDCDSFLNVSSKTINAYTSGHGTKGKLIVNPNSPNNLSISEMNDDDIVQIVPKQLFSVVGDNLHIGDEYGFFIHTENKETYYKSTVLVFDVELNSNLVETIDNIVLNVNL